MNSNEVARENIVSGDYCKLIILFLYWQKDSKLIYFLLTNEILKTTHHVTKTTRLIKQRVRTAFLNLKLKKPILI